MNRNVIVWLAVAMLLLCGLIMPVTAATGNWADLENRNTSWGSPYEIWDEESLAQFAYNVTNDSLTFDGITVKLMADIDLGAHNWTAIGNSSKPFKGTFDGNGYKISNLIINVSKDYQGLFGYVNGATINNVTLTNVDVTSTKDYIGGLVGYASGSITITDSSATGTVEGTDCVGGLVGYASGSITNSSADGTVKGRSYAGGLVGYAATSSTIKNSYATGNVEGGTEYTGGLVGRAGGDSITNSYATGNVIGKNTVGGLVGYGESGSVENSYATGNVTGNTQIGGLVGYVNSIIKNSTALNQYVNGPTASTGRVAGMVSPGTISGTYAWIGMKNSLGDFDGSENGIDATSAMIWKPDGNSAPWDTFDDGIWNFTGYTEKYGLPTLSWQKTPPNFNAEYLIPPEVDPYFPAGGSGTEADPFTIQTKTDLWNLSNLTNTGHSNKHGVVYANANYTITALTPIDIGEYSWEPIGNSSTKTFNGTFDGKYLEIKNLNVTVNVDYAGLFGYAKGAIIKNVILTNVNVSGAQCVGGLVGQTSGSITNSSATGTVNGSDNIGGLVGITGGSITNSSASGNVKGDISIGGLVGNTYTTSSITNSYATGNVNGVTYVGGLVGTVGGSIKNSYAASNVTGTFKGAGGLVGNTGDASCIITTSYAVGKVNGTEYVGGLVGDANAGTITNSVALNQFVNGTSNVSRVWGTISGNPTTIGNMAWESMQTNMTSFTGNFTLNGKNGVNSSSSIIWNQVPGTSFTVWSSFDSNWTLSTADGYKLPILVGQSAPNFNAEYLSAEAPPTPPTQAPVQQSGGDNGGSSDGVTMLTEALKNVGPDTLTDKQLGIILAGIENTGGTLSDQEAQALTEKLAMNGVYVSPKTLQDIANALGDISSLSDEEISELLSLINDLGVDQLSEDDIQQLVDGFTSENPVDTGDGDGTTEPIETVEPTETMTNVSVMEIPTPTEAGVPMFGALIGVLVAGVVLRRQNL